MVTAPRRNRKTSSRPQQTNEGKVRPFEQKTTMNRTRNQERYLLCSRRRCRAGKSVGEWVKWSELGEEI